MTYEDWFNKYKDPSDNRLLFNIIPAYPVFVFLGITIVIILCIIKFNKKSIPLRELEISILIIVPFGIIGGSIFGKVFLPFYQNINNWYRIFYFWEPGMSFYGAFIFGTLSGLIFFIKKSRYKMISILVYLDCIIPNILLGQAVGRWGNLFNHELLGNTIDYNSISWLPDFIKTRLFYFPEVDKFINEKQMSIIDVAYNDWWKLIDCSRWEDIRNFTYNGQTFENFIKEPIKYRHPLFLYESILCLISWLIINFVISKSTYFININNNPWNINPKEFPCYWNKKYKYISEDELIEANTIIPLQYKTIIINNKRYVKLSLKKVWDKAYYWRIPNEKKYRELIDKINIFNNNYSNAKEKFKLLKQKYKNDKKNKLYLQKKNEYYSKYSIYIRLFKINIFSNELEKMNNQNNYRILRCGSITGFFLVVYSMIRLILDCFRREIDLIIPNNYVLNILFLIFVIFLGILIIIFSQTIFVKYYRKDNWLYEKSY